jgi:hypothetical protein
MAEVRKADPGARRQALGLVILGTIVGGLLLVAFERYRTPLRDWLLSEPEQLVDRVRLFLSVVAAVLSLPLVAFAAYLWSTGTKVVTAQALPPPGQRVIRDTPVTLGAPAVRRGRALKFLAVCLVIATVWLWVVIGKLATVVSERLA